MNVILGTSASGGIGVGKAFILPETKERKIPKYKISADEAPIDWNRFESACKKTRETISKHLESVQKDSVQGVLLETYQLMLTDPVFMQELHQSFLEKLYNIEYTLNEKAEEYADKLRNSGNDYLAERAQDITDVFGNVLDTLLNYQPFDITEVPDGAVIVARAMKTSDTVILSKRKIAGLALTEGGISSHVAILAKSYGIPAVFALNNITSQVLNGETIVVDGTLGEIITQPDEATLKEANEKIAAEERYLATLKKFRDLPAKTQDGTLFKVYANIGTPEEAQLALEQGADGIGLFRTEFLFMNEIKQQNREGGSFSNSLSEEAQFEAYKQVLELMADKPVTIRTLDAGGDKLIATNDMPSLTEKNPLMGLRAIRLSLFYPQMFRTQLRALYRASIYGNLKIMIPLITDVSQVETVLGIARGVQLTLKEDNIPFNPDVPIGIMVETAAAAICSDCLAPHSAFFSLGTNDLTQYTLGVDRENPNVAPLYNEYNLAVLRMIELTIQNAKKFNIPVSVCGEMAGTKKSAIILAGMGIRNLSMAPKQIPVIKETLSQFSIEELETLTKRSVF